MVQQADLVVCGNKHLSEKLDRDGIKTVVIPTGYYVNRIPVKVHQDETPVVIGWIGSRGTLVYLDLIAPVIKEIVAEGYDVNLHVISDATYRHAGLEQVIRNMEWSVETEWERILDFDIGIMPLFDEEWSRGKCAFKAIQMMAFGLPVIASPIGANLEVIHDGDNGLLAQDSKEWGDAIKALVQSCELRRILGMKGRETVRKHYSLQDSAESLQAFLIEACSQT
jgi:glycosyltransferase involved in cell wall biosynthesis